MFGSTSNSTFSLISFNSDLLGAYYNARTVSRTVSVIQNTTSRMERGPAVITPWNDELMNAPRTLAGRFNKVRDTINFIDLNSKFTRQTQNMDEKALFALHRALSDLQTIANYAAEKSTPEALLAKLSSQFRGGMSQVQDYVREAALDKLTLMFGEKKATATSEIGLGKNNYDVMGATLAVVSKTQVIPGITGTEVFTLKLDLGNTSDDITMDLSEITEPLTMTSLVNYFNTKINDVTTVDGNGDTVGKYKTRFVIEEVSKGKFAYKIDVKSTEKVTLTAAASEPSLYVTGSHKDAGYGETETATLTKLRNLSSTGPITEFSSKIAGTDQASIIPPLKDDDGKVIETDAEVFETQANATAVDSLGNVYVVGTSKGDFGNQINGATDQDVFLTKRDAAGNELWTRLLGASDKAEAFDLVIDSNDNIFIAGQVNDELVTSDVLSGLDSFVTKFDKLGEELWTYQQDTVGTDKANSLAIDANGDVFVTGTINGNLNSTTTSGGGNDIFVTKLNGATGAMTDSAQIGGAGTELGEAVTIAADGNILVASRESGRVIIRKLDKTDLTNQLASYDLGNLAGGSISDIAVDAAGAIYVAGTSANGSLSGGTTANAHSGGSDGFITKLTDNGTSMTADWTHYLGSSGSDQIEGLSVQNGAVYVAGKTNGTLPGASKTGTTDGFAAKINATTGATDWVRQFGGKAGYNGSSSLAFSAAGSSIISKLGLPSGLYGNSQTHNIETQTSVRAGDHFFISINGGAAKKITIKADDDFTTLAKRIQRLSFRSIKAVQIAGPDGPQLKIESKNGSTVEIIAGKGAKDALVKLGMQPRKVMSIEKLFNIGDDTIGTDPDNLGGIFALKLLSGFSLRSKKEAEYVSTQIQTAMDTVERAFRSLTFDPVKADILKQSKLKSAGPAPAYLLNKIANYQDGLNRLSAMTGMSFSI